MSTDGTPQDSSPSLLTQHLGIVVSGAVFGLVTLWVLGVARFDAVTALAIVQAGGAVNVAIGSVVASASSIAAMLMSVVVMSLAYDLTPRIKFTPAVVIKIVIHLFLALFVMWWFAASMTILLVLYLLARTWLRKSHRRDMSNLHAANSELRLLIAEREQLAMDQRRHIVKTRRLQRQRQLYESQGRTSESDVVERLQSMAQEVDSENKRLESKFQELDSKYEQLEPKFRAKAPATRVAKQSHGAESESVRVTSEIQEQQRFRKELRSVWPFIAMNCVIMMAQLVLMATIGWLPTEIITTRHAPPFPAYVLSQSDKELVLLRRDEGTIYRLPTAELVQRQICRSGSGLLSTSTIGLTTTTPKYPKCPPNIDSW